MKNTRSKVFRTSVRYHHVPDGVSSIGVCTLHTLVVTRKTFSPWISLNLVFRGAFLLAVDGGLKEDDDGNAAEPQLPTDGPTCLKKVPPFHAVKRTVASRVAVESGEALFCLLKTTITQEYIVAACIPLSSFEQFTTVAASLGLKTTRDQLQTEFEEVRVRGIRTTYLYPIRSRKTVHFTLLLLGCPPTLSFAFLQCSSAQSMIKIAAKTHNACLYRSCRYYAIKSVVTHRRRRDSDIRKILPTSDLGILSKTGRRQWLHTLYFRSSTSILDEYRCAGKLGDVNLSQCGAFS